MDQGKKERIKGQDLPSDEIMNRRDGASDVVLDKGDKGGPCEKENVRGPLGSIKCECVSVCVLFMLW